VLLSAVILFSILELILLLVQGLFNMPAYRLENKEILEIFGYFLLILIGIELMDTIKAYIMENRIHVEIILLVAIIAIARKVILLDPVYEGIDGLILIGIGVIIIALCAGYYLVKKGGNFKDPGMKDSG
jgi:uncharacterized membrane protein (DUF373 family)